jgi:hypothetical protein
MGSQEGQALRAETADGIEGSYISTGDGRRKMGMFCFREAELEGKKWP